MSTFKLHEGFSFRGTRLAGEVHGGFSGKRFMGHFNEVSIGSRRLHRLSREFHGGFGGSFRGVSRRLKAL